MDPLVVSWRLPFVVWAVNITSPGGTWTITPSFAHTAHDEFGVAGVPGGLDITPPERFLCSEGPSGLPWVYQASNRNGSLFTTAVVKWPIYAVTVERCYEISRGDSSSSILKTISTAAVIVLLLVPYLVFKSMERVCSESPPIDPPATRGGFKREATIHVTRMDERDEELFRWVEVARARAAAALRRRTPAYARLSIDGPPVQQMTVL